MDDMPYYCLASDDANSYSGLKRPLDKTVPSLHGTLALSSALDIPCPEEEVQLEEHDLQQGELETPSASGPLVGIILSPVLLSLLGLDQAAHLLVTGM